MRARTNIALKNRHTATLTDFKGVDLNTSPLRVAPNRASSMKNFICDNGILHKRPGWEEQLRIVDDNGNALAIHAIFPFSEDGNEILLIHAGTGIYRAEKKDGEWEYECKSGEIEGIDENRASCFYRGGKAYIAGCGNFLCYGKHDGETYELWDVADSTLPYVPTTSIGLGGSDVQSNFEPVNLLTRKRINTVVGGSGTLNVTGEHYTDYTFSIDLDGKIKKNSVVLIEGYGYIKNGNKGSLRYNFRIEGDCKSVYNGMEGSFSDLNLEGIIPSNSHVIEQTEDGYEILSPMVWVNKFQYISFMFVAPPTQSETNITVTFTAEGGEKHTQRIKHCRFGTTFGVNGANDRLFLAGNPDHPNMDFWSEANDFTYFPDGNTMEVGSAHAAINGYARLSDTTLAVLKEEKAGEPTIFYRTGAEKHDTANLKYDAYFPVAAGIAGDGIVNHHAGATLAGDVMVLTRSGVRALVLSSNVASGERYMHDRSRPIYRELVSSGELANAAGIVYRNRYYLALPDAGKCYVADAHYKAAFDGSTDYNYEWWAWDNVHATCFAEYEDKLLFGTPDGLICAFVEGIFADRTFTELGEGDLLCDARGEVIYNENVKPAVGDRVVLYGGVYAKLGEVDSVMQGNYEKLGDATNVKYSILHTNDIDSYYEGQTVRADNVNDTGILMDVDYTVGDIDVNNGTFSLRKTNGRPYEEGAPVVLKDTGFHLMECLDGEQLYVSAVNETSCVGIANEKHSTFTVARGRSCFDDKNEVKWNNLYLTQLVDVKKTNWTGRYVHVSPVRAEWVTPIMDFGSNASAKTLLGFTVATEPGIGGVVTFGYETRRMEGTMAIPVGGEGFDFSGLDFNNFSFDASFACSFTRRMNLRNFNFIVFRFGSDVDQDCAVSGVTLQYKINRKNLGLR